MWLLVSQNQDRHGTCGAPGAVAIENPIRWGEGVTSEMRAPNKALLWAWAMILGISRQPEKSSFPGNPVTDVEAGQPRGDSCRVSVQHL